MGGRKGKRRMTAAEIRRFHSWIVGLRRAAQRVGLKAYARCTNTHVSAYGVQFGPQMWVRVYRGSDGKPRYSLWQYVRLDRTGYPRYEDWPHRRSLDAILADIRAARNGKHYPLIQYT